MATWVTHFRIAEQLIDAGLPVSKEEFVVGNIGPDCGIYREGAGFYPPKTITHFKNDKGIDADQFYQQYLLHPKNELDIKQLSFYLGYYFHLVTDQEWGKLSQSKDKEQLYQDIKESPDYWRLIKGDWYGIDFLYLKQNPDHIFWTAFQYISGFPDYLDLFPSGQVQEQIERITRFYTENSVDDDHDFIYLTLNEVDLFVEHTVALIKERWNKHIENEVRLYGTIHRT